ncbi:LOW QUALITY PROTEIN: outer dense fiber protein 4 [Trichechus inunguis]
MNFVGQEEKGVSSRGLGRKGRAGKPHGVEGRLGREEVPVSTSDSNRQLATAHRQDFILPMRWTSSSSWISQVLASELSLIAFILLLVMVFSKKWLYLSGSRFYQRWPANVSARIHTKAHIMSMGLLQICKSRSCYTLQHGKESFKQWTSQPLYGVAKISFCLALGLGFVLTLWLHLQYLPGLQRLPSFGWIGTIMSFCEVTFIFFTLMLFPINLWIFEWKRNLSIPIGWSYFIGWLVFFLYVTCAVLCYFNQKKFGNLVLTHPFDTVPCSSSFGLVKDSLSDNTEITGSQMEASNPKKKEDVSVTSS